MDVHVLVAITRALRRSGIDVLTAQEYGTAEIDDADLIDRAGELGRVIFTRDRDFIVEAVQRQRDNTAFATVIYGHQLQVSIGRCVEDLLLIASALQANEATGQIIFPPL